MDWYSWLSKTNLEPTFIYEYGLSFVHNELQEEDLTYFNHEFLQSIGISNVIHRVEILKHAKKEVKEKLTGFSKLLNKTKKLMTKNIGKLGFQKSSSQFSDSRLTLYRNQRSITLPKDQGAKETRQDKGMVTPMDQRVRHKPMMMSRSRSLSGALDTKMYAKNMYLKKSPIGTRLVEGRAKEKLGFYYISPIISGPIDRWGLSPKVSSYNDDVDWAHTRWSMMFQDMKPT